jgi:hypothetical protein
MNHVFHPLSYSSPVMNASISAHFRVGIGSFVSGIHLYETREEYLVVKTDLHPRLESGFLDEFGHKYGVSSRHTVIPNGSVRDSGRIPQRLLLSIEIGVRVCQLLNHLP